MAVLLVADHDNETLSAATAKALSAALAVGSPVHVLVAGTGCAKAADAAAKLAGVGKVLVADAPHLKHQLAEEMAALCVSLMAAHDSLVAPASSSGKNFM